MFSYQQKSQEIALLCMNKLIRYKLTGIRSSLRPEAPRTTFLNQSTIRFRNAVRNDLTSFLNKKIITNS